MSFHVNLRSAIYSLSDALDLVGIDELYHGKHVAYIAVECSRHLNFDAEAQDDLFHAAILHDCGVSSTRVHHELVAQMEWEQAQDHCERGYRLLQSCPLLHHLARVVRYHHTHWEQLENTELKSWEAFHSNLIFLADRVDALISQHAGDNLLLAKEEIRTTIQGLSGTLFAPALVDAFLEASENEAFWLGLDEEPLSIYLHKWVDKGNAQSINIDYPTLKSLARIFSNIVDTKSVFTAEHSDGVARLARFTGELFNLPKHTCDMLELAGLLHDLGKLRVPDEILDKPEALNNEEFAIMERHSYDSYAILGKIKGLEEIASWAGQHHEALSGNGYPFHLKDKEIPLEARILSVVDVFQALAQERPYRAALPPDQILEILQKMVDDGKLDGNVVNMIGEHLRPSWQAALGTT